jgi:DNA gyrase/topoisomerase IV subunit B
MADADVDGQHIRTLLLTLPVPLHAAAGRGRARVPVQPPLYKIKLGP